jgi:hypothetical protein
MGVIVMDDWRLTGAEDYWFNKTLYKIVFPAFWEISYKNKNTRDTRSRVFR